MSSVNFVQTIIPNLEFSIDFKVYDDSILAWIKDGEFRGLRVTGKDPKELMDRLAIVISTMDTHQRNTKPKPTLYSYVDTTNTN